MRSERTDTARDLQLVAPAPFPGFLARLGLHGLGDLEVPLLASLASGDPLLLVGGHGAAKTALVRAVARAMGLRFHAYDASKALFEDVIGFPDPSSLATGQVRYVPTPLSIWDKEVVLVDELSRATPAMQNKWLEVVRGRSVMGAPLPQLRNVFAAMNPPAYLGAGPLDPALVGRFAWILQMPEVGSMAAADVQAIIQASSDDDAPLLPGRPVASADLRLAAAVAQVRAAYPAVRDTHGAAAAAYVQGLAAALRRTDGALDGRRLGMLYRNVLLAFAVHTALGTLPDDRDALVRSVFLASLPGSATETPLGDALVFSAHATAYRTGFEGRTVRASLASAVLAEPSSEQRLERYLECAGALTVEEHDRIVQPVLAAAADALDAARPRAYADALRLTAAVTRHHERFPPELVARLLGWADVALGRRLPTFGPTAWVSRQLGATLDLNAPRDARAVRLALSLSRPAPQEPDSVPDIDDAVQLFAEIRDSIRSHESRQP